MSQEIAVSLHDQPQSWAWADWAGMTASIGCAIHCAAMPLVLAYLPVLGLGWLADEGFHRFMAVFCFGLAIAAFVPGWRSHRSLVPLAWAAAGLVLINTAAFGLEGGCCPSCSPVESACVDDGCEHCAVAAKESTAEISNPEPSPVRAGVTDALIPFVTPLGGILLIVGHVMNHRKRCSCQGAGCCLDPI